jgi:two-component system chemotaxis response regulator CheY
VSTAAPDDAAPHGTPTGRVLVVDDQDTIRSFVRAVLEDEGYVVAEAANGQEALTVARTAMPALILLDIHMPVLDGHGFVAAYEQGPGPRAPIVVMSAGANLAVWGAVRGVVGQLGKPFDLTSLLAIVAGFATSSRPRWSCPPLAAG